LGFEAEIFAEKLRSYLIKEKKNDTRIEFDRQLTQSLQYQNIEAAF